MSTVISEGVKLKPNLPFRFHGWKLGELQREIDRSIFRKVKVDRCAWYAVSGNTYFMKLMSRNLTRFNQVAREGPKWYR